MSQSKPSLSAPSVASPTIGGTSAAAAASATTSEHHGTVEDAKEGIRNSVPTFLRSMELLSGEEAVNFYRKQCEETGVKPNNSFLRTLEGDVSLVNFANSYFGDRGMKAVAPTLARIPVIALDLRNTGLSTDDAAALQEALVHHPSLTMLDLRNMVISLPTARRFLSLVTQNKRIATIHVDDATPKKLLMLRQCIVNTESCLYASACLVCLKSMTHDEAHYSESNVLMRLAERLGRHVDELTALELEVIVRSLLVCLDINDGILFLCSPDCVASLVNDLVMACYAVREFAASPTLLDAPPTATTASNKSSPSRQTVSAPPSAALSGPKPKHQAVNRCLESIRERLRATAQEQALQRNVHVSSLIRSGPSVYGSAIYSPHRAGAAGVSSGTAAKENEEERLWTKCTTCGTPCLPMPAAQGAVISVLAKDVASLMSKRMQLRPSAFSRLLGELLKRVDLHVCSIKCVRLVVRYGMFGQGGSLRGHPFHGEVSLSELCVIEDPPENISFALVDMDHTVNYALPDEDTSCAAAVASALSDSERVPIDPYYLFMCARRLSKMEPIHFGVELRSVLRAAVHEGCLPLSDAPFRLGATPRDTFVQESAWKSLPNYETLVKSAMSRRKRTFCSIDGRYDNLFDNVRAAMWTCRNQGRALVANMKWRLEWNASRGGILPTEKIDGGFYITVKLLGVHVMPDGVTRIVIQPMLGNAIGDKGYFYASRTVINRGLKQGAFAIVDSHLFRQPRRSTQIEGGAPLVVGTVDQHDSHPYGRMLSPDLLDLLNKRQVIIALLNALPRLRSRDAEIRESASSELSSLSSTLQFMLSDVASQGRLLSPGERRFHDVLRGLLGSGAIGQLAFVMAYCVHPLGRRILSGINVPVILDAIESEAGTAAAPREGEGDELNTSLTAASSNTSPTAAGSMVAAGFRRGNTMASRRAGGPGGGGGAAGSKSTDKRLQNPAFAAHQQLIADITAQAARARDEIHQRAQQLRKRSRHWWADHAPQQSAASAATSPTSSTPPLLTSGGPDAAAGGTSQLVLASTTPSPKAVLQSSWSCLGTSVSRKGQTARATIVFGEYFVVYDLATRSVVEGPSQLSNTQRFLPFSFVNGFDAACGSPSAAQPITYVFSGSHVLLWDPEGCACLEGGPMPIKDYCASWRAALPRSFRRCICAIEIRGSHTIALVFEAVDASLESGSSFGASSTLKYCILNDEAAYRGDLRRNSSVAGGATPHNLRVDDTVYALDGVSAGPLRGVGAVLADGPLAAIPVADHPTRSYLVGRDGSVVLYDFSSGGTVVAQGTECDCVLNGLPSWMRPGTVASSSLVLSGPEAGRGPATVEFTYQAPFIPSRRPIDPTPLTTRANSGDSRLAFSPVDTTSLSLGPSATPAFKLNSDDMEDVVLRLTAPLPTSFTSFDLINVGGSVADGNLVKSLAVVERTATAAATVPLVITFDFGSLSFCRFGRVDLIAVQAARWKLCDVRVYSSWDGVVFHSVHTAQMPDSPTTSLRWGPTHAGRFWRLALSGVGVGYALAKCIWYSVSWAAQYDELQCTMPFPALQAIMTTAANGSLMAPGNRTAVASPAAGSSRGAQRAIDVAGGTFLDDLTRLLTDATTTPVVRLHRGDSYLPSHCILPLLAPFHHCSLVFVGRTFIEVNARDPSSAMQRIGSLTTHPAFSALPFPFDSGIDAAFYPDPVNMRTAVLLIKGVWTVLWSLDRGQALSDVSLISESSYLARLPPPFDAAIDHACNVWDAPGRVMFVSGDQFLMWYLPERTAVEGPMPLSSRAAHDVAPPSDDPVLSMLSFPHDPRTLHFITSHRVRSLTSSRDMRVLDRDSGWTDLDASPHFHPLTLAATWGERPGERSVTIDFSPHYPAFTGVTLQTALRSGGGWGGPQTSGGEGGSTGSSSEHPKQPHLDDASSSDATPPCRFFVEASNDGRSWAHIAVHNHDRAIASSFWSCPTSGFRFWRLSVAGGGAGLARDIDLTTCRWHALPHETLRTLPVLSSTGTVSGVPFTRGGGGSVKLQGAGTASRSHPGLITMDFEESAVELVGIAFTRAAPDELDSDAPPCDVLAVASSQDGVTWIDLGEWRLRESATSIALHWAPCAPKRFWRIELRGSLHEDVILSDFTLLEYAGPSLVTPRMEDYGSGIGLLAGAYLTARPVVLSGSVGTELRCDFKGSPRALVGVTIEGSAGGANSGQASSFSTSFAVEYSDDCADWFSVGTLNLSSARASLVWESEGPYRFWRLRILHHYGGSTLALAGLKFLTAGPTLYLRHRRHLVSPASSPNEFSMRSGAMYEFVSVRGKVPARSRFVVEFLDRDNATWVGVAVLSNHSDTADFATSAWPPLGASTKWRLRYVSSGEDSTSSSLPFLLVEAVQWYTFASDVLHSASVDSASLSLSDGVSVNRAPLSAASQPSWCFSVSVPNTSNSHNSSSGATGVADGSMTSSSPTANPAPSATESLPAHTLLNSRVVHFEFPDPVSFAAVRLQIALPTPTVAPHHRSQGMLLPGGEAPLPSIMCHVSVRDQRPSAQEPPGPAPRALVPMAPTAAQPAPPSGRPAAPGMNALEKSGKSPAQPPPPTSSHAVATGAANGTLLASNPMLERFVGGSVLTLGSTPSDLIIVGDAVRSKVWSVHFTPVAAPATAQTLQQTSSKRASTASAAAGAPFAACLVSVAWYTRIGTIAVEKPTEGEALFVCSPHLARWLSPLDRAYVAMHQKRFARGFTDANTLANLDQLPIDAALPAPLDDAGVVAQYMIKCQKAATKIVTRFFKDRKAQASSRRDEPVDLGQIVSLYDAPSIASMRRHMLGGSSLPLTELKLSRDVVSWPMPKLEYRGPLAAPWLGFAAGVRVGFSIRWFVNQHQATSAVAAVAAGAIAVPRDYAAACIVVDFRDWLPQNHFPATSLLTTLLIETGAAARPGAVAFVSDTLEFPDSSHTLCVPNSSTAVSSPQPFTLFRGVNVLVEVPDRLGAFTTCPLLHAILSACEVDLTAPAPAPGTTGPTTRPLSVTTAASVDASDVAYRVVLPVGGSCCFAFTSIRATRLAFELTARVTSSGSVERTVSVSAVDCTLVLGDSRNRGGVDHAEASVSWSSLGNSAATTQPDSAAMKTLLGSTGGGIPCSLVGSVSTSSPVFRFSGRSTAHHWAAPLGFEKVRVQNISFSGASVLGKDSFASPSADLSIRGIVLVPKLYPSAARESNECFAVPVLSWIPASGATDDATSLTISLQGRSLTDVLALCNHFDIVVDPKTATAITGGFVSPLSGVGGGAAAAMSTALRDDRGEGFADDLAWFDALLGVRISGSLDVVRGLDGAASLRGSVHVVIGSGGTAATGTLHAMTGEISVALHAASATVCGIDLSAAPQLGHAVTLDIAVVSGREAEMWACGAGVLASADPTLISARLSRSRGLRATSAAWYYRTTVTARPLSGGGASAVLTPPLLAPAVGGIDFDGQRFVAAIARALRSTHIVAAIVSRGVPFAFALNRVTAPAVDWRRHTVVVLVEGVFFGSGFSVSLVDSQLRGTSAGIATMASRAASRIVESVNDALWLLLERFPVEEEGFDPTAVATAPSFLASWSAAADMSFAQRCAGIVEPF